MEIKDLFLFEIIINVLVSLLHIENLCYWLTAIIIMLLLRCEIDFRRQSPDVYTRQILRLKSIPAL